MSDTHRFVFDFPLFYSFSSFVFVHSDKPALGSLATSTAAAAASSAQMSQMGHINESKNNSSSEINAQINGGHLSPRAADVNGALPVLLQGKSSAKAEKLTFLDDFETEKEEEVKKKSSTSAEKEEKVGKSFQELGRRLEAEIATLKEAFRSEITSSKVNSSFYFTLLNFF